MTSEHAEKLSEALDKLTTEENLAFYEESRRESLPDSWRNFGEEEFESELEFIKGFKKDELTELLNKKLTKDENEQNNKNKKENS